MRIPSIALVMALTLPLPGLASEVIVKPGESLSEIAERHGISVSRLMALNGISDPDHVEAGRRLTLPGGGSSAASTASSSGRVTVGAGDTLSEIAERHGISVSRLMALNGISDPDHVEVGQSLAVTRGTASAAANAPATFRYDRSASDHVVRPGESLSRIASGYGIAVDRLVAINAIADPDHVRTGTRLRLKGEPPAAATAPTAKPAASAPKPAAAATPTATATAKTTPAPAARPAAAATPVAAATAVGAGEASDWRTYGPLQIDWANWEPMGGSMVAPTLNDRGESVYLAINCTARKLNATTLSGQWQTWNDPAADFEEQLVRDLCANASL
jgi:LysM repeat protein